MLKKPLGVLAEGKFPMVDWVAETAFRFFIRRPKADTAARIKEVTNNVAHGARYGDA